MIVNMVPHVAKNVAPLNIGCRLVPLLNPSPSPSGLSGIPSQRYIHQLFITFSLGGFYIKELISPLPSAKEQIIEDKPV